MSTPTPQRRVVCSACRLDGILVLGPRMFHPLMIAQIERLPDADTGRWAREGEQGFVDQDGVFMTREEAWTVAEAAGQIVDRNSPNPVGMLLSYHLYP